MPTPIFQHDLLLDIYKLNSIPVRRKFIMLFLKDLTNLAERVFYFEEGPEDSSGLTGKDPAEDEKSEDAEDFFVIY